MRRENFDFSVYRRRTPSTKETQKRKPKTNCKKLYAFYPWVGGKFYIKRWLKEQIPGDFKTYCEPFLGAGSLFLELQPKRCIINDINPYLPLMFWALRNHFQPFLRCLDAIKAKCPTGNKSEFLEILRAFNDHVVQIPSNFDITQEKIPQVINQAAHFLYIAKRSHNGNLSVNAKGELSADYWQARSHIALYNPSLLTAIHNYLQTADIKFMHGDYRNATKLLKRDDFVYLDPPYMGNSMKCELWPYSGTEFSHSDFIKHVHTLTSRQVKVAMTNNYDPELIQHFSNERYETTQMQNVRGFSQGKNGIKHRNDVLIINYKLRINS